MDLINYTLHALTPTLSLGRGSKSPIPLLLREKGLGDEGLQGTSLSSHSLDLIHDPHLF